MPAKVFWRYFMAATLHDRRNGKAAPMKAGKMTIKPPVKQTALKKVGFSLLESAVGGCPAVGV